ncbi:MAG: hypothetical protein KGL39_33895 [Patescibacteria group bacterium]|nr:hypothetical protein [Patescibacteria group bacterium]
MKRELVQSVLKKAMKHTDHGRDVKALVDMHGEDAVIKVMESFQDILSNRNGPRSFQNFERTIERQAMEGTSGPGGITASQVAVFSLLGVTAIVADAYMGVDDLPLQDLCITEPSHTLQEPKAWTANPDMPQQLADMEEPQETKILQRSTVVTNSDFGIAFNISRRAIDDDQVGQLSRMPAKIGENHKRQEEIYAAGYLTGAAFSTDGVSVPAPSYTDPDGLGNGMYVTSTNRQNAITPVVISQNAIQNMIAQSKEIRDWDGKNIIVKLDKIIGGTQVTTTAGALLHGLYWPSQPIAAAATNGTVTGTFMTPNPLDPKMKVLRVPIDYEEEPYFNFTSGSINYRYAWFAMQSKWIGLVKQDRQALETLMEAPNSGNSLRRRAYYHRTYRRYAYYIGDARFLFRGNDGSVTS